MRDPGMSAVGSEPENLRKVQRDRDHRVGMQTARSTELEELRRLAARYGVPVEVADRLTLRPREVARATGFGLRTVERWIATGRLPAIRVDEGVAVALHDLLRFFEENRAVPTRRIPTSLKDRAQLLIEKGSRG
jgi:excisionase family DNA binding protein